MPNDTEVQDQETGTDESIGENESHGSDSERLESESAEQADDAQDPDALTGEEDNQSFKGKSGNFDWKKINELIGDGAIEKAFKESQKMITRVSQENKQYREKVEQMAEFERRAQLFDRIDQIAGMNPALRAQLQAALSGQISGQVSGQMVSQQTDTKGFEVPPGVLPNDPLLPVVMKQQEILNRLEQQSRMAEETQRRSQYQEQFRQGLNAAKDRFKALVGRDATETELRKVAAEMSSKNMLQGDVFVTHLFFDEISKSNQRKLAASNQAKRTLPKTPNGVRQSDSKTAKRFDLQSFGKIFDDWAKESN